MTNLCTLVRLITRNQLNFEVSAPGYQRRRTYGRSDVLRHFSVLHWIARTQFMGLYFGVVCSAGDGVGELL